MQEVFSFPVFESLQGHEQVFQLTWTDNNKHFCFEWIIAWGKMGPSRTSIENATCSAKRTCQSAHSANKRQTVISQITDVLPHETIIVPPRVPSHVFQAEPSCWNVLASSSLSREAHTIGDTVMQMFTRAEPTWLPATGMGCCFGCASYRHSSFPWLDAYSYHSNYEITHKCPWFQICDVYP